jgi:dTDP-4-dehydrorhamnose reductase
MKIAVIGSTGQLGTDLLKVLGAEHEVYGLTHSDIEVSNIKTFKALKEHQPDVIINTAAFHKTDQCEEESLKTFSVNALGARNIALISKEIGAIDVYISTDYVFDGLNKRPYTEKDVPAPINTYGISKLAAEHFTKQNPKHYILRIASVFGAAGASGKGGNFVETMINKAKKGDPITVINDMWMSPTYTKHAAFILKSILEKQLQFGIYHATNKGYCSWYQFAEQIFRYAGLNPDLKPIKTAELNVKAKRPRFSALESTKLPKYGIAVPTWQQALQEYLIEKGHNIKNVMP